MECTERALSTNRTGKPSEQQRTFAHGNEKATILTTAGAKGRGKTRALLEIATHLQKQGTFVIFSTFNSFSSVPFRVKHKEEPTDFFARQDLTARVAYAFYRQTLADGDSFLEFTAFAARFDWNSFSELVCDITRYAMEALRMTKIVFLFDEVLTICEWFPEYQLPQKQNIYKNDEIVPLKYRLQYNNALTAVLRELSSFCESSPNYDFILSSLDENLFDGFCTDSGRKLQYIPLPLIPMVDAKKLYFDALQLDHSKDIPDFVHARFDTLCRFIGRLPRHISVCAEILFTFQSSTKPLALPLSCHNANTKYLIDFVSGRFCAPDPKYFDKFQEKWLRILCHVVLHIFSYPLSKAHATVHAPFLSVGRTDLGISYLELCNIGIFATAEHGASRIFPCMMVIISLLQHCGPLSKYAMHSFLKKLCVFDIFCKSGIPNEQFHSLW
eukprot:CAMPEP_0117008682 /NCGR_PEP_ID=MMETSP0472-20121206/8105_1 /TAXON_ID=693140 ORGANISM="Tiarina fusus, Strain LIS" /NCGR_SAMPLE_ID=MMETSP0472 /ASSEMBLY_ACC=CAM_ASM_000603 /LENGTH=441 /DNA_ID=CAMNT_0004710781 /DNA_START=448 /DNA_END=1770 /DNA_ORIENTATION=+